MRLRRNQDEYGGCRTFSRSSALLNGRSGAVANPNPPTTPLVARKFRPRDMLCSRNASDYRLASSLRSHTVPRGFEDLQELTHKERQIHPGPRGNQISFHHYFCILKLASGEFYIWRQGFVGGDSAAANSINGSEDKRAVTERCDWFLRFHEMANDLL